jgi:predicted N-acetyltransferase YhbS
MSLTIRPETPADYDRIFDITEAAFRDLDVSDHTEQHLVSRLRNSTAYISELALVAELDGEVVGHILFTRAAIDGPDRSWETLVLAPVSVAPPHQKCGIGGRLIRAGIQIAHDMGFDSINLVGHAEYYPKFGFVRASRYNLRLPFDVPDEAFMIQELRPGALNGVSGVIRYAPEFGLEQS